MGAWKNAFFLQEKAMSIKFLVFGAGGSADFIFVGTGIYFSDKMQRKKM